MKKGEIALLIIAPEYAFGSSESQLELAVVPPNSTVYYEVELVSFEKVSNNRAMNCDSALISCFNFGERIFLLERNASHHAVIIKLNSLG